MTTHAESDASAYAVTAANVLAALTDTTRPEARAIIGLGYALLSISARLDEVLDELRALGGIEGTLDEIRNNMIDARESLEGIEKTLEG